MFDALRSFFQRYAAPAGPEPDDRAQRLAVATCALLLEVANADQEFSADERETVTAMARERFGLTGPQLDELLALAEERRQRSTDLFEFTQLIAESYDRQQKLAILELLWRVVYSDGRLEAHEDALLHKLAHLLGLRHDELIAIKLKVKNGPAPA